MAKNTPVAEPLAEELPAEAVHTRRYRHLICNTTHDAGWHTEIETHLPCPTCGSEPPAHEFVWE